MQSIYVTPPLVQMPAGPPAPSGESADLLRQLVELQREHLGLLKQQMSGQDERAKWKTFHGRFADDFPDLPATCKRVLPVVERAYLTLMSELTERLGDDEELTSEFAWNELLDRYGVRLMQLGNILGQVGHLANVAPPESET